MKKISLFLIVCSALLVACDLQPKITALPDTVGDFISARYPALLADPTTQPEIYNSAATDYGVYAAPEIYGNSVTSDDYVLYSSVDDYIVPPADVPVNDSDIAASPDVEFTDVDDTLVVGNRPPEEESKEETIKQEESTPDTDASWPQTNDVLDIPNYMYGGHDESEITVARGDTLYAIGAKYGMKVAEIAKLNNLSEPYNLSVGQKLRVRASREQIETEIPKLQEPKPVVKDVEKPTSKPESKPETTTKQPQKSVPTGKVTTTRVELSEIKVAPGDTLYSLSRQYAVPVNDLAVMNNLNPPFALYAGQVVKVPNLASAPVRSSSTPKSVAPIKSESVVKPVTPKSEVKPKQADTKTAPKVADKKKTETKKVEPAKKAQETKKTNDKKQAAAVKKLPAISARSSSKFSWPVRGKILSNYGSKPKGLFNDGINIGASRGTTVMAAENGVVAYAGNEVKGMGNLIIIQHSDGWMTVYAHMDSLAVRRGARVGVGQKIGTVGQTGKVDKPQLHFEIRKGTRAYNPIQYLKK